VYCVGRGRGRRVGRSNEETVGRTNKQTNQASLAPPHITCSCSSHTTMACTVCVKRGGGTEAEFFFRGEAGQASLASSLPNALSISLPAPYPTLPPPPL